VDESRLGELQWCWPGKVEFKGTGARRKQAKAWEKGVRVPSGGNCGLGAS
jgi:hypothetical protein